MIKWDGKWNKKIYFFSSSKERRKERSTQKKFQSHIVFLYGREKKVEWAVLEVEIIIIKQKLLMDLW